MSSRLIDALVTTDALADAFCDRSFLRAMLEVEAALARAGAHAGVVPASAAESIGRAATTVDVNIDHVVTEARADATLSIPVVKALTERVAMLDEAAAAYVHRGATSQDVFDTALVLCVRRAWSSIAADHDRLVSSLSRLAVDHAGTVMLGRTLLQPAVPTTFGLKAAGWLGAVSRTWQAWAESYARLQVLQFGGAAGTLAALGASGPDVERALAAELALSVPDAPWHAHRDRIALFVAAAGVHTASLGKVARDVSLLMQHEVGEVCERGGGSSTMPHKRNPSGCAVVLAAATRLPGIVASVLAGSVHEHERAVGGWQAEGAAVADAVQSAGSAVCALADTMTGLTVDPERMRHNVDETRGVVLAEQLSLLLRPAVGRTTADALVQRAIDETTRSHRPLAVVVAATPEIAVHLTSDDLKRLADPSAYLGSADHFRRRLIESASATSRTE